MIGLTRGSRGGCALKLMRTYSAGCGGGPEEKDVTRGPWSATRVNPAFRRKRFLAEIT